MLLKGKTAVITGCLQGIGRETMKIFAENGANIFACCEREAEEFKEYVVQLSKVCEVEIKPIYFDMREESSIRDAARAIQKEKKQIDILVNIAGITRDAVFQMVTMEQMLDTFQVNFFSQIVFTQYITKLMLRTGGGSVIFTSSITGLDGNSGQLSYGASKAALIAATKTMSKELGNKGIRVNAIAPGVIKTPMTENLTENVVKGKLVKADIKKLGEPKEVANLILYLSSEKAAYITGQIIRVDGGIG